MQVPFPADSLIDVISPFHFRYRNETSPDCECASDITPVVLDGPLVPLLSKFRHDLLHRRRYSLWRLFWHSVITALNDKLFTIIREVGEV